jgi:hypothetical protein
LEVVVLEEQVLVLQELLGLILQLAHLLLLHQLAVAVALGLQVQMVLLAGLVEVLFLVGLLVQVIHLAQLHLKVIMVD